MPEMTPQRKPELNPEDTLNGTLKEIQVTPQKKPSRNGKQSYRSV